MDVKIKLDPEGFRPRKAHKADAGYDIYMPCEYNGPEGVTALKNYVSFFHPLVVDTGVHIAIPEGYVGFLKAKSGLNVKFGITGEGVIDSGYTGSIVVKLYSRSPKRHYFETGDKLIQLVLLPIADSKLVLAESLDTTERGDNGFGSTGV